MMEIQVDGQAKRQIVKMLIGGVKTQTSGIFGKRSWYWLHLILSWETVTCCTLWAVGGPVFWVFLVALMYYDGCGGPVQWLPLCRDCPSYGRGLPELTAHSNYHSPHTQHTRVHTNTYTAKLYRFFSNMKLINTRVMVNAEIPLAA